MQTKTLEVRGMTCGHCKMAVEGTLKRLEGVSAADADLNSGKVEVAYDESKVSSEQMKVAIEDQGYKVA